MQSLKEEHRKKVSALDKYVIFSFAMIILFTLAEFITSMITGIEHSTLIVAWFGVWGGEVLSLALIKIFKLKEGNNDTQ